MMKKTQVSFTLLSSFGLTPTTLSKDLLLEYDQNIFGHTLAISEYRDDEVINWKYFQYVTSAFH